MNQRFLKQVSNCQTATRPQTTYEVANIIDDKRSNKLRLMTLGYATMHVPLQAREIDAVIVEHGFRE